MFILLILNHNGDIEKPEAVLQNFKLTKSKFRKCIIESTVLLDLYHQNL